MQRLLSQCQRLVDGGSNMAVAIASALCLLMALHIVLEIVLRFLVNMPLPGTVAIVANYYMVAVTFLPLAAVEQANAHISVEIVTERFSKRAQWHLQALVWLLSGAMAAMLTWATLQEALAKARIGAHVLENGMRLALWPAYYLLPLGCGLLTLVYLVKLLGYVFQQRES